MKLAVFRHFWLLEMYTLCFMLCGFPFFSGFFGRMLLCNLHVDHCRCYEWKEKARNCRLDNNVDMHWGLSPNIFGFKFGPSQVGWQTLAAFPKEPCSSVCSGWPGSWNKIVALSLLFSLETFLQHCSFVQLSSSHTLWSWRHSSFTWPDRADMYRSRWRTAQLWTYRRYAHYNFFFMLLTIRGTDYFTNVLIPINEDATFEYELIWQFF